MDTYAPLRLTPASGLLGFPGRPEMKSTAIRLDAPAVDFMTDFRRTPAVSVLATSKLDTALDRMISSGVRVLFVIDSKSLLLGSITSYDIQGNKPLQYLQSRDCRIGVCSRLEIEVGDIMTPVEKWRVLTYGELGRAAIGDIAHTFKTFGLRHLIVTEADPGGGGQIVRGLVSASDLERALARNLDTLDTPESFADIARAIARRR